MACNTKPNIASPDDFYAALVQMYDGLDDAACMRANARLILLLANHVGDERVLREAVDLAARPENC